MKYSNYLRAEGVIMGGEQDGIVKRIVWGRRLLCDPKAMTASGKSLQHGKQERLIGHATMKGYRLSEREIRYRLQAARAYPTRSQIGSAAADFASWRELCDAGFPPVERPPDEPDFEPASADQKLDSKPKGRGRKTLPDHWDPTELFDPDKFPPEKTLLRQLQDYTDEQAGMTSNFQRRDEARQELLFDLVEAVDGDVNATWSRAQAALDDQRA